MQEFQRVARDRVDTSQHHGSYREYIELNRGYNGIMEKKMETTL